MFEWIKKIFNFKKKVVNNDMDKEYLSKLIRDFLQSPIRKDMITGKRYYKGEQDILNKKRLVSDGEGRFIEDTRLVNSKVVNNQYAKLVDQKVNYILGKPLAFSCDDEDYLKEIRKVLNKRFNKIIKYAAENAMNCGIAYIHPYFNENGELLFKIFDSEEIIPVWKDDLHEELDYAIRVFNETKYDDRLQKVAEKKVEVYKKDGVDEYILRGSLQPINKNIPYITISAGENKQFFNWGKVPIVPFKYNKYEIPLINRVKSLQDGINKIISNFEDNMEEDIRNTIFVLVNYGGQDLAEFKNDLSNGAINITTVDGIPGDVRTLKVEVNADNYKTVLDIFKKAIIENGKGFDSKDDRLGGTPNELNIRSMYADIDLDSNAMETEFQSSLENLIDFVNLYLGIEPESVLDIIFDRDVLINETQTIENCAKSVGILSDETIISMHPWVKDPKKELERIKSQKENEMLDYNEAFKGSGGHDGEE